MTKVPANVTQTDLYLAAQRAPQGPVSKSFKDLVAPTGPATKLAQDRALGFSEAGMFGVTFSVEGKDGTNSPAVGTIPSLSVQSRSKTPSSPISSSVRAAPFAPNIARQPSALITAKTGPGVAPPHLAGVELSETPHPRQVFAQAQEGEAGQPIQYTRASPTAQMFRRIASALRSTTGFRLEIFERRDGVSIIFEDHELTLEESEQIANIARKVAAEFGVTIKRVLVNNHNGPFTGSES
jgi:hypothetical protein